MNQIEKRLHREIYIKIGYFIEMLSFVIFGMFIMISRWESILFMIVGVIVASIVTKKIENNAVENFKWGLE